MPSAVVSLGMREPTFLKRTARAGRPAARTAAVAPWRPDAGAAAAPPRLAFGGAL